MREADDGPLRALARLRSDLERGRDSRPVAAQLAELSEAARDAARAKRVVIEAWSRDDEAAPLDTTPRGCRLSIPIRRRDGVALGSMSVELADEAPVGAIEMALLDVFAARAGEVLQSATREAARVSESSKREAVHSVVRASVQHLDLDQMLQAAVEALRLGLRSQGVWIRAFDSPDPGSLRRYAASYPAWADSLATDELLDISGRAARICWDQQRVSSMHLSEPDVEPLTIPEERDFILAFMRSIDAQGLLMAPLGGAGECQGFLSLTRTTVQEPFDATDELAALAIGREVGAAIVHARLWGQQLALIQELRDLDVYKSDFIAKVAHELKNPLASISGHSEMLGEDLTSDRPPDRAAAARSVQAIERGAARILETVDSLLTLSKVQDAHRALIPGEVRMSVLIEDSCEMMRAAATAHQVRFDDRAVDPGAVAWGDRSELATLVDNLIGNAVKYSPDGGTVVLSLGILDDEVVFACRDHGLGIPDDDLARLFEPFYRSSDSRALQIPGTGLGMAIVRAVVDRHHGRITVDSTPHEGSLFEVFLPTGASG